MSTTPDGPALAEALGNLVNTMWGVAWRVSGYQPLLGQAVEQVGQCLANVAGLDENGLDAAEAARAALDERPDEDEGPDAAA